MSMLSIILAVITVVGMTTGQILFKVAADRGTIVHVLTSPYLWVAACLYGGVTIAWVLLLREMDLARAYPILAACYVLVPLASALILGERFGTTYGVGVVLIIAGIALTLRAY